MSIETVSSAGADANSDHHSACPMLPVAGLMQLQSWLSASFPIGAYSYSHGLEQAIADNRLQTRDDVQHWLEDILEFGSGWNDSLMLMASWRACEADDGKALAELNALSLALAAGVERWRETHYQGDAFLAASAAWETPIRETLEELTQGLALPVAVGALCASANDTRAVGLRLVNSLYLQSLLSNLVWIAGRLLPLGQNDCLQMIAALAAPVRTLTERASTAPIDELGGCALCADLASLQHEQLPSRICQS